ncbi:hypothetical protein Shyhy01_75580 [Streptomyces hygroscopicus subsp. hygroscopicus]|uniref:hypothetical protein n=1 Tax=Streptomyces sp. KHY 26 TaxID=3097359 RepID=UPI0024A453FC|nr:hypothetical protein [Streptomyces hygroscopicus]GLX54609.1 hypothetical protein Shyhy01_75580 [Streptomyces hygroscopicus subsp. hygroscopicus]
MSGTEVELEKDKARYGLLAVMISNVAIVAVAVVGVWQLRGDTSVIVGILTAAFTAVSSMTTAYLGIKAVSNTARSMSLGTVAAHRQPPAAPVGADGVPAPAAPTP